MTEPIEKRFWKKVDRRGPDECWEWTASLTDKGYGQLRLDRGRGATRGHRFSYELHHGPIPAGLLVRHKCDNPPCVNPAHLELGTYQDNRNDRQTPGRAARAAANRKRRSRSG